VTEPAYALSPRQFLRSVDASRDTLQKARMKLIDIVEHLRGLTGDAPYAVVGGLAQILWAKKTHTDDLDVTLAATDLASASKRVRARRAPGWRLPKPPDLPYEQNAVFEVYHLLFRGSVVDLLAFRNAALNGEILTTSKVVRELRGTRFIRPELLLVTHLLRPGTRGALAAVELLLARRAAGDFDMAYAERWAGEVGRAPALARALARADEMSRE
jgi:hypothetical protein